MDSTFCNYFSRVSDSQLLTVPSNPVMSTAITSDVLSTLVSELLGDNSNLDSYGCPDAQAYPISNPPEVDTIGLSLNTLTPPDTPTDCGNSSDVTGLYETATKPKFTQCVMCGVILLIIHCVRINNGFYNCYKCHHHHAPQPPQLHPVQAPENKKRQSAKNKICINCNTTVTSLWRRNTCNACYNYERLHKRPRPQNLRKDVIQRRKRTTRPVNLV